MVAAWFLRYRHPGAFSLGIGLLLFCSSWGEGLLGFWRDPQRQLAWEPKQVDFGGILKGNLLGLPCWLLELPVLPKEPCLGEGCPRGFPVLGRPSDTGVDALLLGEPSAEELCRVRELPLSAVLVII